MREFWVNSGLALLDIDEHGGLHATDDFLRAYLLRPELAPIEESCAAERQLHEDLLHEPARDVTEQELVLLADADARENYALFLRYRTRLLEAPTLQAAYMRIHTDAQKVGRVDIPPLFIDQLTQIILHQALVDEEEPTVLRAAEIWFRPQRVMLEDGRVILADEEALQAKSDPGMGELGRMLASGGLAAGEQTLDVLNADNKAQYFGRDEAFDFALEVTHGRPGATALGNLIERWVLNMLGVRVKVRTLSQIDDSHWRWHIGLDAQGTALLNQLYEGESLAPAELRRLLLLARLDFVDMADQRSDIAGKPVYLALGMDESGLTRFKPQNLLLNLPVAVRQ
ncbi:MAG: DUF6352 family protein [Burkholderiaceae bacterium]